MPPNFCPNCGIKIKADDSDCCPKCGIKIGNKSPQTPTPPSPPPIDTSPQIQPSSGKNRIIKEEGSKRNWFKIAIGLIGFVVVAVVFSYVVLIAGFFAPQTSQPTVVTPFPTPFPTPVPPTTLITQDKYCRIYSTKNSYANSKTAIAFNLQNPPMYINYTVQPSNVTRKIAYTSKVAGEEDKVITIDTYSPVSWFEVTVRSKSTGEIYLQDGFGTGKGYNEYLNRTLKVLKRDNMQIEFAGNDITATSMVWVKPYSNIDDTSQFNLTTDCAYFDPKPRDMVY